MGCVKGIDCSKSDDLMLLISHPFNLYDCFAMITITGVLIIYLCIPQEEVALVRNICVC